MDPIALGAFLRARRAALQPQDVGLPRGSRRRTAGLRREEVSALVGVSADYYARLERGAGPQPSEQMVAALARGLRLSLSERDHLFTLSGHEAPRRATRSDHVGPALMRILDRLQDTPAQVMGGLGETLVQTPVAIALFGAETHYVGPARSAVYRWFTDPGSRAIYLAEDHHRHGRTFAAQLRHAVARNGPRSAAAALAGQLQRESPEFAAIWADQEIGLSFAEPKRFIHPEVGRLDLHCQTLVDPETDHTLLIFTAVPGSPSHDTLQLLAILGQTVAADPRMPDRS
jgi:transcriptional regulator with XRE-family HTH domain